MRRRKTRKLQRSVKPVITHIDWRLPVDVELLAAALLDMVESMPEAERAKFAKDGQATSERLGLKFERDTDDQEAA